MAPFEILPLSADSHESEEEVIDCLSSQDGGRAGSETGADYSELAVEQTSSSDAEVQPTTCCGVISAVLREVVPSLIATLIMGVYNISLTAVICTHQAFREHQGVLVTLAMGSAAVACFSYLITRGGAHKGAVFGANNNVAPFLSIMATLIGNGDVDREAMLPTLLIGIMGMSSLIGLSLYLIGRHKATRFFALPFPVVTGFIASVGFILVKAAIEMVVMCDIQTAACWDQAVTWPAATQAQLYIVMAAATMTAVASWKFEDHPAVVPVVLVTVAVLIQLCVVTAIIDCTGSIEDDCHGWFFSSLAPDHFWSIWSVDLSHCDVHMLWQLVPAALSGVAVTLVGFLVVCSATEVVRQQPLEHDDMCLHEGIGITSSLLLGGMPMAMSITALTVCMTLGTKTALPTVTCSFVCLAFFFYGASPLALIPKAVFSVVMGAFGLKMFCAQLHRAVAELSRSEVCLVLCHVLVTCVLNMVAAVVLGLGFTLLQFIFQYAQLIGTRSITFDARSNVVRTAAQRQLLNAEHGATCVIKLRGFLFFASARAITRVLWSCVEEAKNSSNKNPIRFLLIDFSSVIGVDSSVVTALRSFRQLAKQQDIELMLAEAHGVSKMMIEQLRNNECSIHDTLDFALEECEQNLLACAELTTCTSSTLTSPTGAQSKQRMKRSVSLDAVNAQHQPDILLERQRARASGQVDKSVACLGTAYGELGTSCAGIFKYMEPLDVPCDYILFAEGASQTKLFFIETGYMSAFRSTKGSVRTLDAIREGLRLKKFGPGTFVGVPETLFMPSHTATRELTSYATAITDTPCCIQVMEISTLAVIERENQGLALALFKLLGSIAAERYQHVEKRHIDVMRSRLD